MINKLQNLFSKQRIYSFLSRSSLPSIRKIYRHCLIFLVASFIIIYLGSSCYYFDIMKNQMYRTIKGSMDLYNEQTAHDLDKTMIFLSEICTKNTEISYLNITDNEWETYEYTIKVKRFLSLSNLTAQTGGMFLYFDSKDLYIPQINGNARQPYQPAYVCSDYLSDLMRKCHENSSFDSLDYSRWNIHHIGDNYFLIHLIRKNDIYAGAWINIDTLLSYFTASKDFNACYLFVNNTGTPINNSEFRGRNFDAGKLLTQPTYLRNNKRQKYLVVTSQPAYCDGYITALIPHEYLVKQLSPVIHIFILLTACLILSALGLYFVMIKFFNAPLHMLEPAMQSLKAGNFDTSISTRYPFEETQNFIDTINKMVSEIQNLKIRIYENRLSKKELQLQYLKNQIAPHFLINCLNTIFVLSQDKSQIEASEKLIQTLSDHLRYTLSNRTCVPLYEEINYVSNYIEMTKLRFPGSLTSSIDIDPRIKDANVFPLLVLMLTENSIKTNIVMGEMLTIEIRAELIIESPQPQIHITHIDSGTGFDEKSLRIYNHILDHPEIRKNGYSIGIYNIASRLRLTLGENSTIVFSNELGKGARIDIIFPYLKYRSTDFESEMGVAGK